MSNPFAVRFREAAFTLEETNIPEIAEMLHIAAREIDRLEETKEAAVNLLVGFGNQMPSEWKAARVEFLRKYA